MSWTVCATKIPIIIFSLALARASIGRSRADARAEDSRNDLNRKRAVHRLIFRAWHRWKARYVIFYNAFLIVSAKSRGPLHRENIIFHIILWWSCAIILQCERKLYTSYNNAWEVNRNGYTVIETAKICFSMLSTRLTVYIVRCTQRRTWQHLHTVCMYVHACNKCAVSVWHRVVRTCVHIYVYMYIHTSVLTFFEDAVTKTSNHHFSLSLSHNDSHTRFSFLFQLRSACGFDIACTFKESNARASKISSKDVACITSGLSSHQWNIRVIFQCVLKRYKSIIYEKRL